jgi:general secretion pathway protein I
MATSKRFCSRKGTTLLEVMVAVAVAAIALISFITLVISALEMEDQARRMTQATVIAEDKLKEIERTGFPELSQVETLVDETDPAGFTSMVTVTDTPIQDVRQVEVQVLWDNKRRSVGLVGYFARR